MNTKYNPTTHNRRSIRLKGYDYSQEGWYFLTICTHNKQHLFGEIENYKMILNDVGKIVNTCWLEIPEHFPNVTLHEFVIMPNHIHGIIEITNVKFNRNSDFEHFHTVGAEDFLPLQCGNDSNHYQNNTFQKRIYRQHEFQKMIPRSIASIVKGLKIGVTKWCRNNTNIGTVWQRNYYEQIIRDEYSFQNISQYIIDNPKKWNDDRFFI